MEDLNDKITGDIITAAEWNQIPSEIQNVITDTGQTLSAGDLNQLGKGIANYSANSIFYTDSGAADAYVLTKIGSKQSVTAYTDGMQSSFNVDITNTGASTINVDSLGVKSIVYKGAALNGGELTAGLIVNLVFDLANDRFELIPNLSNTIAVDGGWVIGSPGVGSLGAGTLNVENEFTCGGNVGIGTTSPDGIFHIFVSNAGVMTPDVLADNFLLESGGDVGMTFMTPTVKTQSIHFGNPTDAKAALINFNYDNALMQLGTHMTAGETSFISGTGTEALRLDNSQIALFASSIKLNELSSAPADTANYGQVWVKDTVPNELWFTDDAGNDSRLRESLAADRTYFVRTDGNDSNNGRVDSAGGAYLTLQKAINEVMNHINLNGFDVIIDVGNGTYTGQASVRGLWTGDGIVTLQGDTTTPANVVISTTSINAIQVLDGGVLRLGGFKLQTTTSGSGLLVGWKSVVYQNGKMDYGTCVNSHIDCQFSSTAYITADYNITGGAQIHWHAGTAGAGVEIVGAVTITLTGTPNFSSAFAGVASGVVRSLSATFSGSATGQRYLVYKNGFIDVGAGTVTTFPGDVAGVQTGGGTYTSSTSVHLTGLYDATLINTFTGDNAAGPAILNEAASSSNPTLCPNKADLNTGMGWVSADTLSLVAGSARIVSVNSTGIIFANAAGPQILNEAASATNPTLCPNRADLDTGIGWNATNVLSVVAAGSQVLRFSVGGIFLDDAAGPKISNSAATATNPTLIPNRADANTGIGWDSTDKISFICGGASTATLDGSGVFTTGLVLTAGANIFTATATIPLSINRLTDDGVVVNLLQDSSSEGSISIAGAVTSFNTSSDYRRKLKINTITNGTKLVQQLNPVTHAFINNPYKIVDGFIAHEVQEVCPMAVQGYKDAINEDGTPIYQQLDSSKLIPILTAALKETINRVENLELVVKC